MSLELFNAVPAGAIEILLDEQNQPFIHRAQYGRFIGLKHIHTSIPEEMKCNQVARSKLKQGCQPMAPLGRSKNPHDVFLSTEVALYIAMRSDKHNAKLARKWLIKEIIPRGLHQIITEKQAMIEEKDMQLALLNDDLTDAQRSVVALEQDNLELQAEVERLAARAVPYLEDSKKDNGMVIIQKNNGDPYPYIAICGQQGYVAQKIQNKLVDYPNGQIVVLGETPNAIVHYNWLRERGCIVANPNRVRHFMLGENYTHQRLMELQEA